MDSPQPSLGDNEVSRYQMLKSTLMRLHNEQAQKDSQLSDLTQTRNMLLKTFPPESAPPVSGKDLAHYPYIFPLLSDIYMLELKIKEQQKNYEEKKLQLEAAKLGQAVFTASLEESDCVLKRWARQLTELASRDGDRTQETDTQSTMSRVTNITYHTSHETQGLNEDLAFTVLCQGVHLRVRIRSRINCSSIHFLSPRSAEIGVNSDTYVPGLVEKVQTSIADESHISMIVSMVSKYIQEDMAPYVIIIPMKKKGKKSKGAKTSQKSAPASVDIDTSNKGTEAVASGDQRSISQNVTSCSDNRTCKQADLKEG